MIAHFNSKCPYCGQRIEAGTDDVTKKPKGWAHTVCPTEPIEKAPRAFASTAKMVSGLRSMIAEAPTAVGTVSEESAPLALSSFEPSTYQTAIFDWIKNGSGNAVVEAVAGSGKTTTLIQALSCIPSNVDAAFCAFNKHIAEELKSRAPSHVKVGTLHSFGFGNLRRTNRKVKTDKDMGYNKLDRIMDKYMPIEPDMMGFEKARVRELRNQLSKVVALAKATLCDGQDIGELEALTARYGLDLNDAAETVLPFVYPCLIDCMAQADVIDFDDMLWLPIVLEVKLTQYDWLLVDEAQDLNKCQIEFVLRSVKPNGRVIVVGDRKQSLYGFRGADTEAIPNLIAALEATILPLSICYRCPSSHVELAKVLVPQIEARPNAPEGLVQWVKEEGLQSIVQAGNMIVCRVNAPLVPMAFDLIRRGIKATVRGRDIGKGLVDFVKKFQADDLPTLSQRMNEYVQNEVARLSAREGKEMQIETLLDKQETIEAVASECSSVEQIKLKLETLFSDAVEGVVLSSVHRAKGLQAKRVVILRPDLLPHPRAKSQWQMEQEMNAKYVAITRSTSELYFVEPKK